MLGYAATEIFTLEELRLHDRATRLVAYTHDPQGDLRCHELARALQRWLTQRCLSNSVEPLVITVADGYVGAVEHSWLVLPKPLRNPRYPGQTILDPYRPGMHPMVQLVDETTQLVTAQVPGQPKVNLGRAYRPGYPRHDIDDARVEHLLKAWRHL